jgi:hypothetical protein
MANSDRTHATRSASRSATVERKKPMTRRLPLILLVLAALMLGTAPAAQAGPGVSTATYGPITGVLILADCGGFEIVNQFTVNYSQTVQTNRQGAPTKITEVVWGSDSVSKNGGSVAYTGNYRYVVRVDLARQKTTTTGVVARIAIPGRGVVLLDAGKIVSRGGQVTYRSGTHQLHDGDFAALCAALA